MTGWTTHWLEAGGDLSPWRAAIEAEVAAAREAIAAVLPPPRLDVLVQRLAGGGIPEFGMVGHAYHARLFCMTFDPDNPNFVPSMADGALRRQVVHEAHHCLRMAGPGYGRTLGEALVSEGLAGQFVRRALGTPPEIWEAAVPDADLARHAPDRAALGGDRYDHRAWFFGAGGTHPRWLGYTLGYRLAGLWLDAAPRDAAAMVGVPAAEVLDAALPRLNGEP